MKKIIIYLITTILIILIIQPLSLTSSAATTELYKVKSASIAYFDPSSVDSSGGIQEMRVYNWDINNFPVAPSGVVGRIWSVDWPDFDKYPTYLAFNDFLTWYADPMVSPSGIITVDYGVNSFSDFNSLSFSCNVFFNPDSNYDPESFFRVCIDGKYDFNDYTVVYSLGPLIDEKWQYSDPPVPYRMRTLNLTVYFDKPFKADTYDINLEVFTCLPGLNSNVEYLFGFGELQAELKTELGFMSEISAGISNLNNQQVVTNEKLGIMGDTMDDIRTILSQTLPPEDVEKIIEGQQALEEQSIIVKTNAEAQAELDATIDAVFERYENIDYDLFGDNYGEYVQEYVDPVFEHSGFLSFWNGFWSHRFVIAMIITVITFCAIGFALYGIR